MQSFLVFLPLLLVGGTVWSDRIGLRRPTTTVELRTYGFGVIPFDGIFTRFDGWMRFNPSDTNACEVMLEIEADSLVMENDAIGDRITGPDMMDTARFPSLAFQGIVDDKSVAGDLTMHGQTRPVTLSYRRAAGTLVATGELRRADWGITGSPVMGGPIIRIRVVLPDPFSEQRT